MKLFKSFLAVLLVCASLFSLCSCAYFSKLTSESSEITDDAEVGLTGTWEGELSYPITIESEFSEYFELKGIAINTTVAFDDEGKVVITKTVSEDAANAYTDAMLKAKYDYMVAKGFDGGKSYEDFLKDEDTAAYIAEANKFAGVLNYTYKYENEKLTISSESTSWEFSVELSAKTLKLSSDSDDIFVKFLVSDKLTAK